MHHNHPVYAHNFSITDDSTISTIIEQIKTETQLVNEYFLSRNSISAIEHAKNAANLSNDLNDKLQGRMLDITQAYTNGLYNSTTLALVVANLVDEILRNYGSAYGITYDLTNMSNMMLANMSNNILISSPNNVTTIAGNDTLLSDAEPASILENNNPALVNIFNYQTAQALSNNVNSSAYCCFFRNNAGNFRGNTHCGITFADEPVPECEAGGSNPQEENCKIRGK